MQPAWPELGDSTLSKYNASGVLLAPRKRRLMRMRKHALFLARLCCERAMLAAQRCKFFIVTKYQQVETAYAPWEARTPDLEVNSLTLWPTELRKPLLT